MNRRGLKAIAARVGNLLSGHLGSYSKQKTANLLTQWTQLRIMTRSPHVGEDLDARLRMGSCPSVNELSLPVSKRSRLSAWPMEVLRRLRSRCPKLEKPSPRNQSFPSHQQTNQQPRNGNTLSERSSMEPQWILLFPQRKVDRCRRSHDRKNMSSRHQSRSANHRGHHLPIILRSLLTRLRIWRSLHTTMPSSSLMR